MLKPHSQRKIFEPLTSKILEPSMMPQVTKAAPYLNILLFYFNYLRGLHFYCLAPSYGIRGDIA